jgi:hypothetical protein
MAAVLLDGVSPARLLAAAAHRGGGVVTGVAGVFASQWRMKVGPKSAKRSPRGIITSHGRMTACVQRFDTSARYTGRAHFSPGGLPR